MSNGNFYTPNQARGIYGEIVPVYQWAFEGPPWNEVSKCVDSQKRCPRGFSSNQIGEDCGTCGLQLTSPAYESDELTKRFDSIAETFPTAWYIEHNDREKIALAALAWRATPKVIAEERYANAPKMSHWLSANLGDRPVVWLDEIFADRKVRPTGNLRNFKKIIAGMAINLGGDTVAYRTISKGLVRASVRDFGRQAEISKFKDEQIPDPGERDFIKINLQKEY